ncbi:MAG: MucB/RseB C-terminal domain-containing protein [Neisseria sp.]|nr:MucB/RseB C-terminal domain-containing protein [Neisseria sp.]
MPMQQRWLWLVLGALSIQAAYGDEWAQLTHAAKAGQTLNLEGQYVRQTGEGLSTFAIYRLRQGRNVVERRIALDGAARELIRTRNSVRFFTADSQGLLQAKMDSIRFFPATLPSDTQVLKNSYAAEEGDLGRIAGKECRWVWLIPHDADRYTQGFCVDTRHNLPLIQTYKNASGIKEINVFTHLSFTDPSTDDIAPDAGLTVQDALQLPPELNRTHLRSTTVRDAYISQLPDGFFILRHNDMKTANGGQGRHYVIGDGLIHVSLFIEQLPAAVNTSHRVGVVSGALSMAEATMGDFKMIAIGDLPPRGLSNLLRSIEIK